MLKLVDLKPSNTYFEHSQKLSFKDQECICGSAGAFIGTTLGGPLGTVPGAKIGSLLLGGIGAGIGIYSGSVSSRTIGLGTDFQRVGAGVSGYYGAKIGSALGGASLAN